MEVLDTLANQIRATGARATPARVRVLQLLRAAPKPLSHPEIEQALGPAVLDRVTLYRVLDWLVDAGLAHKAADGQRLYRFSAAEAGATHGTHAHFRCEACGRVLCLDLAPPTAPDLPPGFRLTGMEVDLHGLCPECAGDE